jgi:hypothetical protein
VTVVRGQALNFVRSRIAKGTIVNADESPAWNDLHARFEMSGSIMRKPIRWTALARIGRRNFSPACAAPKSAIIITSPGRTFSATRKRRHGARITDGSATGSKSIDLPDWR